LLAQARRAGRAAALPAIMAGNQPLKFRSWAFSDRLRRGRLGILEPPPDAAELVPDVLLVPLAASTASPPNRLWRRTLRAAPCNIARIEGDHGDRLGFAAQEVEAVPALLHDVALDYVLTETQMLDFRS